MSAPQFILASASPRRADLLRQIGLSFVIEPADIDEPIFSAETPEENARRLALEKARIAVHRSDESGRLPVLAGDTFVVHSGDILGKPKSPAEAKSMLLRLSADSHKVISAVAVQHRETVFAEVVTAEVEFRSIQPNECDAYLSSQESFDKAGGYGIQSIGAIFVQSIRGQPSTVAGLPLLETEQLLARVGVCTWQYRVATQKS